MWYCKSFKELTIPELEQIFRLRQSIFIVEQKSYFNDIDGKDYDALHLYKKENEEICAYSRIHNYENIVKFGRVTVKKEHRGNGNGKILITKILETINEKFPDKDIHIMAMSYLREFYESFGFQSTSDVYIIDQHPHEDMVLYR